MGSFYLMVSVIFVIARFNLLLSVIKLAIFNLPSLQSDFGQNLLAQFNISKNIDSVILIEHGQVFFESTAALKICKKLDRLWPCLYLFILVPPFIRNALYRLFAKYRYRLFGQKSECLLPTPSQRQRFLS